MRHYIKHILLLIITIGFLSEGYSQDAVLLLQNNNPLYLNPALTGYEGYTRIGLNYRNHFPAAGNGFVTYGATLNTYIDKFKSGIGISIMRDQPGSKAYNYNQAMFAYSYNIPLGEKKSLRAGLLANLYYSVKDPSNLKFPDMIDGDGTTIGNIEPYPILKAIGLDAAAGTVFTWKRFMLGASIYHIGNNNDSSYHNRPLKLNLHADWRIPLSSKNTYANPQGVFSNFMQQAHIQPYIYYMQQSFTKLLGFGVNLHAKNLCLGIGSRQDINFKSMLLSARVGFVASFMEIDYIFDIGKFGDNFKGLSATSHEIGIIFKFGEEKEY